MVVADFSRPGGIKLPTQIDTTRGKREIYKFIYLLLLFGWAGPLILQTTTCDTETIIQQMMQLTWSLPSKETKDMTECY